MLASRECSNERPRTPKRLGRLGVTWDSVIELGGSVGTAEDPISFLVSTRVREYLFLRGAAFVLALSAQIRINAVFGDEFQTCIDFRRTAQSAGDLDHEQNHHGIESLQVRLLIDGEIQITFLDRIQGYWQEVKPSAMDFTLEIVRCDGLSNTLRATRIHRKHPF